MRCTGFVQGQFRAAAVEPAEQGVQHVGGPVADGKDLAGLLDLGGTPSASISATRSLGERAARAECRKLPWSP